jgi:hypothetical protein
MAIAMCPPSRGRRGRRLKMPTKIFGTLLVNQLYMPNDIFQVAINYSFGMMVGTGFRLPEKD